ncbi:hypothetical protein H5410_027451 [Solanum commersonii]|uniref:Uncharacterized protein n=1 Tax=Solanum commersonii TaxID=4109 RepID=A0A9J5Z214_SOLCO|nr:hypothetical protein H5410_027451 [Solanum commersonii]
MAKKKIVLFRCKWFDPSHREILSHVGSYKSKSIDRFEVHNMLDVAYQNDVEVDHQIVNIELENSLEHREHILDEVDHNDEVTVIAKVKVELAEEN